MTRVRPRDQLTAMWETTVPYSYIGWGKTTQLGAGLGMAHGAKLAKPDWTVINVMGDASIGMVGMDFETGVRCKIGTLTVVLKNSIMGEYTSEHPNACDLFQIQELGGDYKMLAESLGGYAERVSEPAELKGRNRTRAGEERGGCARITGMHYPRRIAHSQGDAAGYLVSKKSRHRKLVADDH